MQAFAALRRKCCYMDKRETRSKRVMNSEKSRLDLMS
jgi:hypothetical protein